MKDSPEVDFQYYLFKLAQRAYKDRSLLNEYNCFVPFYHEAKWKVNFGTEEELKPIDKYDLMYKIENLFGIGDRKEFKTVEEEIWFETAEYICDYINPYLYPEDYDLENDDVS